MTDTYKTSVVVYLDIFFFMNFFLDYIAISLTGIIIKKNKNELRYIFSAAAGACGAAIYTYILLSINIKGSVRGVLFISAGIIVGSIVTKLAYQSHNLREMMTSMAVLLVVTYAIAGGVDSILRQRSTAGIFVIISAFVTAGIVRIVLWIVKTKNTIEKDIYDVKVNFSDRCVQVKGLLDTGNALREPFSNRPVCIIEAGLCDSFLDESYKNNCGVYVIPYTSIGKNKGVLYGVMVDSVNLTDSDGKTIKHKEKVIVALYEGRVSSDDSYQMILHKELLIN